MTKISVHQNSYSVQPLTDIELVLVHLQLSELVHLQLSELVHLQLSDVVYLQLSEQVHLQFHHWPIFSTDQ